MGARGLIALLHRLGLDYHKPNVIPRKLDEEKQKAFIASYEKLLNSLADVPCNWANLRDSVTDNFRVISPNDFRVMA